MENSSPKPPELRAERHADSRADVTPVLVVSCTPAPNRVRSLRNALRAFLTVLDVDAGWVDDVLIAVGEGLTNVVEHAYEGPNGGHDPRLELEMSARVDRDRLIVEIRDNGRFIYREPRTGRGFGLRIARAIARDVAIDASHGTRVQMTFDVAGARRSSAPLAR